MILIGDFYFDFLDGTLLLKRPEVVGRVIDNADFMTGHDARPFLFRVQIDGVWIEIFFSAKADALAAHGELSEYIRDYDRGDLS